jgi:hypothetical protein
VVIKAKILASKEEKFPGRGVNVTGPGIKEVPS